MAPKVGVGACRVVWAAVGQGKCVPMHGRGDVGLWSPVSIVAIPFLVAGTEMLDLAKADGLLRLECRGDLLWAVEEWSGVMMLPSRNSTPFGLE